MGTMERRGTVLRSNRSNSERLFESSNVGNAFNFLHLSEHGKNVAQRGIQRRTSQNAQKNTRRASIFNSLDKFLDDDATESTSYQSSFSSGFSSETQPQHVSNSFASGTMSRMEPNIAEEGEESNTAHGNSERTMRSSHRYRRRGSVTKYVLGQEASNLEPDASFQSNTSSNDDSFSDLHTHKLFKSNSFSSHQAEDASEHSVDERPVPVIPSPMMSIDSLPIPMKHKTTASDNHNGRPPLMRKSTGSMTADAARSAVAAVSQIKSSNLDDSHHEDATNDKSRRYRRRGSVTKFSLDDDSQSVFSENPRTCNSLDAYLSDLGDSESGTEHTSVSEADVRSCHSEGILPRVRLSMKKKKTTSAARSNSSGAAAGSLASFMSRQHKPQKKDQDEDASVASSIGMDSTTSGRRYHRRGSVTKYSLDDDGNSVAESVDGGRSCVSEGALHVASKKSRSGERKSKSSKLSSSSSKQRTRRESSKSRGKVLLSKRKDKSVEHDDSD